MGNVKLYDLSIQSPYLGLFATSAILISTYPSGELSDYAYVTATNSYWYWSTSLNAWVNQQITEANYNALSTAQKAAVPYIVGV